MKQLKDLRKQHGYTQKELGDKVGLAPTTIASYEQGHRKISVPVAVNLGKVFKKDWTIFFEDEVRKTYDNKEVK